MNAAAFRSFGRQSFTGITGACLMAFWATGSWAADPAPALRLSHELRAVPAEPSPSPPTASGPVGHWADQADEMAGAFPRGRIGTPEDAAGTAIYLSSRASAWVTGHIVVLDGGAVAAA